MRLHRTSVLPRLLRSGNDQGASFLEYSAVLLLVAAILAAVLVSSLPGRISDAYHTALCMTGITDAADCETPSAPSDGGPAEASTPNDDEVAPTRQTPTPDDRRVNPESSWPYQVVPVSGSDIGPGEDLSQPQSEPHPTLLKTNGTLSPEESPLYTDPGEYPQMYEVEESEADYQSLGEGKTPFCAPWNKMCCPENTCDTIKELGRSIQLARLACLRPGKQWAYCRPNAADYLEHFLRGSGEDMNLDMDVFLDEVPEFQEEIETRQQELIDDALHEAELRDIDGPLTIPISTEKTGWGYPKDDVNGSGFVYDNPDWANAIGSFHYWMEGEITVYPPDEPGGDYSYELNTSVNMEKWYDWERNNTDPVFNDWKRHFAGDYSQADLAKLHQYGMAQEFWVRGGTDLPAVKG